MRKSDDVDRTITIKFYRGDSVESYKKPEVELGGLFTAKDINLVPRLVNKAFEKQRRDRIVEGKRAKEEIKEEESDG